MAEILSYGCSLVPYRDLEAMASQVVKSKMFPGITTPEAAMTLFLLCQSEGLHPMQALTRYHVISGRPAMKADAMLAEFMRRGGTVEWVEYTDEKVAAVFTSKGCPSGVMVTWTLADARRAGITGNPTWTKYPRQMLKARVASDGVRMADPAVNQGRWTPEEHESFEEALEVKPAEIVAQNGPGKAIGAVVEDLVPVLEASLRQEPSEDDEAREDLRPPLIEDRCEECNGAVGSYVSKKGVPYHQCEFAHELFLDLMAKGKSKQFAGTMTRPHFYQVVP